MALTNGGTTHHNAEISRKLADLGFLGLSIPEAYGGTGGGLADACLVVEEIAYNQIPVGSFAVTLIVVARLSELRLGGTEKEILGNVVAGGATAIAMSEPGSGSDVASLRCKAQKADGGYRLNGQKMWISNAHYSDHILLVARTSDTGDKHQGMSMFSVPTSTPGVEIRPIPHDGRRGQRCFLHRRADRAGADRRDGGPGLAAVDRRSEHRTGDRRGAGARSGPAIVRRHTELRQDAPAVRPAGRYASRRSRSGWRIWPPRSNVPGCWSTTSLSEWTRTPASSCRRRPQWSS